MSISIQSNGKNRRLESLQAGWTQSCEATNEETTLLQQDWLWWLFIGSCWVQNILCTQSWYSPRVVGHENGTLSKPFVSFYYLFLHTVYTKNQLGKGTCPEYQAIRWQGFRWQPSLPSSVLGAPQHRWCSSSLGCSRQLQGSDLHYWDRTLTAHPPCRPYPNRHMARQYTLANLVVYCMQTACSYCSYFSDQVQREFKLSERVLQQHFSIRKNLIVILF